MLRFMRIIRNIARTLGSLGVLIGALALLLAACGDEPVPEPQAQRAAATQQAEVGTTESRPAQQEMEQQQSQPAPAEQEQQQADDDARSEPAPPAQGEQDEQAQQESSVAEQHTDQQSAQEQQEIALPIGTVTFLPLDATETAEGIPIIRDNQRPRYFGLDWSTAWSIRLVDLDDFSQGAARDAIPAISGPLYVTLEEASAYYTDNVPLVQVNIDGDVRGFPLEILTWHEIVNDTIGGMPITVTYCPLCNTAIAFESQIGEEVFKFGVSGLLRNSDLVMYDRNTESLWQQSSGRAIVGAMVGARLTYVPAPVVSLGQLRSAYPDAIVMSRDTGWFREYGQNPYRGYDDPERGGPYPFFFDRDTIDERLPPAERVVSIEGPTGAAIAYAWSAVADARAIHDTFDGVDLVVFWTPGVLSILDTGHAAMARDVGTTAVFEVWLGGRTLSFTPNPADEGHTFIDEQTGSVWDIFGRAVDGELAGSQLTRVIHSDHFWFAWQAFHPDTEVVSMVMTVDSDG